jgi:glucosamine 6-phosphate synthetase-like amidotransferase/phosphosugar isomerase protein
VVEIAQRSGARRCVAITANAESALAAAADVVVLQHVHSQRAVTHTQALAGAYACGLAVIGDELAGVVEAAERAVVDAEAWAAGLGAVGTPAAAIAVGGGAAWAAALELALMLKEISRIPAEGVETREGATSAMFGLDAGHLMVSLDPDGDALGDEAVRLCAAAGATTLRLPAAARADARLAPITTLPAAAALAAELALAAGHDVDKPAWTDAYYETARSAT